MQNINRLDQELAALASLGAGGVVQQRQLLDTLEAAPISHIRPSAQSISRLGATLASVVPSLRLTPSQRRQLAIDINMALNCASLSLAQSQRVIEDARSLLQMTMARNPQGVEQLVGDLSLLVGQVQGSLMHPDEPAAVTGSHPATAATQTGQSPQGQSGQASGSSAEPNPPPR